MIDINLIPESLRKNTARDTLALNLPREILLGVSVGIVFLLLVIHFVFGVVWLLSLSRLYECHLKWENILPEKNRVDELTQQSNRIKNSLNAITSLTVKKSVLWAPKFNAISDALPKGLWIRTMTLEKSNFIIEGTVVSKTEDQVNNIDIFLSALKKDEAFMKDFSALEVNAIERKKVGPVEVAEFTVIAELK